MQKQGFSRREFLSLAGATGGVALLAACQAVAPAAESGGTEASMEPVNVSVQSGWYTSGDRDIWTPSIELFHENVPNITVELVRLHVTPEDTMTAIAGGTAPDIYHRYIGGFSELMARGVMYPLDDLLATVEDFDRDIYLGPQWEGGMWDGVTFGVPCLEGGAMPAICWHKNIIDEIGGDPEVGPRTWGEMLDWARKINQYDDDGNLTRAGFDPRDSFGITIIGQPVIFDENYISGDKRTFNFDSATYAEGLEILAQFWIDAGTPQMNAFAGEWGYWSGYPSSGFNSGKRAMVTDGNWLPGMIRDMEEVTGVLMEDIGYGFHPNLNEGYKAVDFGSAHTLFMPRNTEVPEAGVRFMTHMTTVEVNLIEFEIRAACMWSKPLLEVIDLSGVPGLEWFFDAPLHADRLWSPAEFLTPVQSQVENLWARAFEEVTVGAKTADEALFDINSELQQSLDEYWETQA